MENKWNYYAFLAMLIWAFTVMGKPKGDIVRNLWIGYAILGAALGMNLLKFKDEDNNNI